MIRRYLTILTLLFAPVFMAMAQIEEVEAEEIDDDEDAIVVINEEGEKEEIDVPEGMNVELDSLLQLFGTENYLTPDSDCDFPDVNPIYEPEVYKQRLRQLPTIMEMPYNTVVQKFIDRYCERLRRTVSIMLGRQNFYMPIFEQALETYSLPLELRYLPVIESALKPTAVSRVGATGLWQFMLATGKQYGLEVNSLVDERRDPILSSYAAAHYLSDLYRIFGDWSLVIAAYNCGPENINKAIHRAGGVKDYWQIYPYLPAETRGYVPAFIAANYVMNYYCDHNICPMLTDLPAKTDTIMVNRDVHFEQIAAVLEIDVEQVRELNPQYRRDIVNGNTKPSAIRLPSEYVNSFIDNEDAIYAYNAEQLLSKRHEVEVNDNIPTYTRPKRTYSKRKGRSGKRTTVKGRGKYRGKSVAKRSSKRTTSKRSSRSGKKSRRR